MKQNNASIRARRKLGRLASVALAAALIFGTAPDINFGVYASEISDDTEWAEDEEPDETSDSDEDLDAEPTPKPTKKPKATPTPDEDLDEEEEPDDSDEDLDTEPTPKPTKKPKPTPTPDEDLDEEEEPDDSDEDLDTEPTPKPTKKPKPTPDPDEDLDEEENPNEDLDEDENSDEDLDAEPTPKPTKKPKPTPDPDEDLDEEEEPDDSDEDLDAEPTPKPTKKPKPTPDPDKDLDEEENPDEDLDEDENPDEDLDAEPTPTPTPTKKPTPPKYSANVPAESYDARYQYLFGINAREITMKTPPPGFETKQSATAQMVTISVPVWKMRADGSKYSSTYKLTINRKLAEVVKVIFKEIYALDIKFPIKQLNGFMYRKVGGVGLSKSTLMSVHSFGAAIDINPGDYDNDYFLGKGNDLRDKSNPYCIPDEVIEIFEKHNWFWGGNFEICADTMHFQYLGLEMLHYQNNSPFRTLQLKSGYMKGTDVRNLQQRLRELGYKVTVDGVYGSKTASAIQKYQRDHGLEANGIVDYKTWETIINETHYMSYVF